MKFVCSLAFVTLTLASSPVLAQDASDNDPGRNPPLRRYLAAFGGVADVGSENTMTLAGEFGDSLTRNAQAYANFSYFDNVMTDAMRDNLIAASDYIEEVTGVRRTFSGRDRGLALTFGGKYVMGTTVRPYVGAGAGGLQIQRTITESSLGNVSEAFATQAGLGDGVVSTGSTVALKPMAEFVTGIGFVTAKTYVDVGYRYRRAFHSATALDFSQLIVGIGAKW